MTSASLSIFLSAKSRWRLLCRHAWRTFQLPPPAAYVACASPCILCFLPARENALAARQALQLP